MKWLRLLLSVVLFPLSLIWYKRDIHHHGIPPLTYWLAVVVWMAVNVVLTILAWKRIEPMITDMLNQQLN